MLLSQNDVDRLGCELAVANTGSFVYRRFNADPVVRALAFRKRDDLLKAVQRASEAESLSLTDEVDAYAATVALLNSGAAEELRRYERSQKGGLRWLRGILAAFSSKPPESVSIRQVSGNDFRINIAAGSPSVSTTSGGNKVVLPPKRYAGIQVIDVAPSKKNEAP